MSNFVLIDENAELQPGVDKYIENIGLISAGRDYNIISIIGA